MQVRQTNRCFNLASLWRTTQSMAAKKKKLTTLVMLKLMKT